MYKLVFLYGVIVYCLTAKVVCLEYVSRKALMSV